MAGATVALTFQVECSRTKPGDAVFICGSAPALGGWKTELAVPCITTRQVFPNWTSETVMLPSSLGTIEFKVLVQPAAGGGTARWEEGGGNRSLVLPNSNGGQVSMAATVKWGRTEVLLRTKLEGGGPAVAGTSQGTSHAARMAPVETYDPAFKRGISPKEEQAAGAFHSRLQPKTVTGIHFAKVDTASPLPASPSRGVAHIPRASSATGVMQRNNSRHLCINADGMLNTDMSRTPSLMLIDEVEFHAEAEEQEKKLESLERERLNRLQRRMPSGSLIDEMRDVVGEADKDSIVMIQGFNWESWRAGGGDWYSVVKQRIPLLTEMGVTDVWIPPCSQSVAPQGYLPSQLFNLDGSKYGSQESLEDLLKSLHDVKIRGVADVVVNHRCGDKQDAQGRWNQFSSGLNERRPSFAGVMDWGGWAITLGDRFSDGTGQNAPHHDDGKFDAAPDIDHRNQKVQQSISIWLRWLQLQVGFDAWRFDFVKGYGAEYVGLYCKKSAPAWAVGELWGDMAYDDQGLCYNQDRHRQDLCDWISGTDKRATAFDFTTKGILQEACKNSQYWRLKDKDGKPPGLIGWWPKNAVTFIDNHDTGSTQRHWPFPDDKVLVGYAYICTHPGIPCIFWDHVMDWGEDHRRRISDMLRARRAAGIKVSSPVKILAADADFYLADIGSPATLRVALGPRGGGDPQGDGWSMAVSGKHFKVWLKKQASAPSRVPAKAPLPAPAAVPAPVPAPAPAPAMPAFAPAPEAAKPAWEEPKAAAEVTSFPPINIDGHIYTPQKIQEMGKADLEKLTGRLEPVYQAARSALASGGAPASGGASASGGAPAPASIRVTAPAPAPGSKPAASAPAPASSPAMPSPVKPAPRPASAFGGLPPSSVPAGSSPGGKVIPRKR